MTKGILESGEIGCPVQAWQAVPTLGSRGMRRDPIAFYQKVSLQAMTARLVAPRSLLRPWQTPFEWCFTAAPEELRRILFSEQADFNKGKLNLPFGLFLGNGLLTSDGNLWKRQRVLLQPAFTFESSAAGLAQVDSALDEMFARWSRMAGPDGAFTVDIIEELGVLTMDIVCRTYFGVRLPTSFLGALVSRLHAALDYVTGLSFGPRPFPDVFYLKKDHAFHLVIDLINADVVYLLNHEGRRRCPFVDILGEAKRNGTMAASQIRDEVVTVLHAGQNTLASGLLWAILLMVENEKWIDAVSAERSIPDFGSYAEHLNSSAGRCFLEALRLYPPAWGGVREPLKTKNIGGLEVPEGGLVVFSQYSTHRHPDLWESSAEFAPERYIDPMETMRHDFRYFPFGAGPRRCPGEFFAVLAAVRVLHAFFGRYKLSIKNIARPRYKVLLDLEPQGPIIAEVRERWGGKQ